MATNEPLVPSMIFRSRTTKASSKVTEQNACRRSFSLWSSMSLMRTSVITTVVLLFSVAHSRATPNDEHFQVHLFLRIPDLGPTCTRCPQLTGNSQGLAVVAAQGK